jgi:hydroxymethylpyrimidine/phosphomethylpyrimidine kinase
MKKLRHLPTALTIAGSDSGGGAGIQADLKTFAALAVHGTSAITCVTAQNPKRVLGIECCKPETVRKQIEAVFAELPPMAMKTGMLFSPGIINVLIDFLKSGNHPPLVVDPVMISTSGTRLLQQSAGNRSLTRLLPYATLITPNLDEAGFLLQRELRSVEDLRRAAKQLHEQFGCAALVKGGHLRTYREAVDVFFDGKTELLLSAPFVKGVRTHGTGCTYSAAITAYLAKGRTLPSAVALAKNFITGAIKQSLGVGKHTVMNPFH